MNKIKNIILLSASMICFAAVAACLFAVFFVETDINAGPSTQSMMCGAGFWLFIMAGIVLQVIVSMNVKRWCKQNAVYRSRLARKKIGLVKFFSNLPAFVSDVVLLLSLVIFIVLMFMNSNGIFAFLFLSVLFLSICAHCVFNGKNYYYITHHDDIMSQLKMEEK